MPRLGQILKRSRRSHTLAVPRQLPKEDPLSPDPVMPLNTGLSPSPTPTGDDPCPTRWRHRHPRKTEIRRITGGVQAIAYGRSCCHDHPVMALTKNWPASWSKLLGRAEPAINRHRAWPPRPLPKRKREGCDGRQKLATPRVPTWSPTAVLTRPDGV